MDAGLVERVLEGLGLSQAPPVSLAGLTALYDAWCRNVPFDNVAKLIHVRGHDPSLLPGNAPEGFFETWLRHGCGGTCWAGNGALHALLEAIGFEAHRAVATMLVAPGIPPNHGSVVVRLAGPEEEEDYVVDASILHREPLRMAPGEAVEIDHRAWGVEGHWVGGGFRIRWRNFMTGGDPMDCAFDAVGVDRGEFSARHEATRAWSPFNFGLCLNLVRHEGRIGAALGRLMRLDAQGTLEELPAGPEERRRFLVEEIRMSPEIVSRLPDDVPMAPPPAPVRSGPGSSGRPGEG
jgi:N-hydroxyarylamine O-acetyltransferase